MKIDNFKLVKQFFDFDSQNNFLLIQLIRRQKDNPSIKIKEGPIKIWIIHSYEELLKYKQEIINFAEVSEARVYINLTPRNNKQILNEMLRQLATYNANNNLNVSPIRILYSSIATTITKNKRWIIDVDDVSKKDKIINFLNTTNTKIFAEIPTKNNLHLIVKPFNRKKFADEFPNIDVHPNSMGTILYIPASLN